MILSCKEVGPLFYWPKEERCAPKQMYCDMGRFQGMAILRSVACSDRHYHFFILGYTAWRCRGIHYIHIHFLLIFQYLPQQ